MEVTTVKKIAKGGFEITDWQEKPAGASTGPKVTRATVKQKFTGDIKGTGTTEYLMVYRPDKTAEYSGVQVITGTVGVRKGSFALLLRGKFDGQGGDDQVGGCPRRRNRGPEGFERQGWFRRPDGQPGQIHTDLRHR